MSSASAHSPRITPKQPGKTKSFTCPNCAGTVTVKAIGHSISAVCAYCSSIIDIANENFRLLSTANERTRPTLLTIGNKGVLAGILWEIIGYMEKTDSSEFYRWDEYLLYNPFHGFRFLILSQGHWTLFKVLKRALAEPDLSGELKLDGKKFQKFQGGATKVSYVKGEFYWRVRKGEESHVIDYIAPPYMLSVDKTGDEINIALGEYIDPKKVENAFVLSTETPKRRSVGANQPGPFNAEQVSRIWFTLAIAFLTATVIQMASSFLNHQTTLFESSYTVEAANKNQTISTESFSLPKQSNLQVSGYSRLDNDWLELDFSLINERDETVFEGKQALEYYMGMDYDGSYWSEGNQTQDNMISAVPPGNYRLLIDADAGAFPMGKPVTFIIQIKRGISSWSNYGFTVLFLLLYPLYAAIRYRIFESSRWSQSDFSDKQWG